MMSVAFGYYTCRIILSYRVTAIAYLALRPYVPFFQQVFERSFFR
jgi:hypothetical protein